MRLLESLNKKKKSCCGCKFKVSVFNEMSKNAFCVKVWHLISQECFKKNVFSNLTDTYNNIDEQTDK